MSDKITNSHKASTGKSPGVDGIPKAFAAVNILIVDDEHLVALGIASSVRELGHTVVGIAGHADAATKLAREVRPDLVLMDISMPEKDGIDTARSIFLDLGIPSVIVSAYSDQENLSRIHAAGESAGILGYLLKPVTRESLRVQIGVAIQRATIDVHQRQRIGQLESNIANRRTVEQAKWIIVSRRRITEPEAHDLLQKLARDRRKPLLEIAQAVIATGDLP